MAKACFLSLPAPSSVLRLLKKDTPPLGTELIEAMRPLTQAALAGSTMVALRLAFEEDAQVIPNRRVQSMTWRTDIRTPGLPPNTRRLGDLRLECRVGMEAGLISNSSNIIGRLVKAILDTPAYCDRPAPLYLFFADKPLFSVAMVSGQRREILSIDKLYASASDDPALDSDLPYCDCEILVDRTYVLPLGDRSWPDDTLVEFEYMDDE